MLTDIIVEELGIPAMGIERLSMVASFTSTITGIGIPAMGIESDIYNTTGPSRVLYIVNSRNGNRKRVTVTVT